jgi:dihydrofolate reductase
VVAVAENGVIGRGGSLPWRQPSDLRTFRRLTMGKPVIMGRRTYQSIGKPLDGRDNIVVTRDASFAASGITAVPSLDAALQVARAGAHQRAVDEVMIIGGAEIYAASLPIADRIYLSRVHATVAGDTVFPALDPADWREVSREPIPPDPRDEYSATLLIFERIDS